MFKMSLLSSAALIIVAAGIAASAERPETAIPNFMSADFGWLLATGVNFRALEGKVAPVGADPHPQGADGTGPVIRERMSTSVGRTSENPGFSKTSSKVNASRGPPSIFWTMPNSIIPRGLPPAAKNGLRRACRTVGRDSRRR